MEELPLENQIIENFHSELHNQTSDGPWMKYMWSDNES